MFRVHGPGNPHCKPIAAMGWPADGAGEVRELHRRIQAVLEGVYVRLEDVFELQRQSHPGLRDVRCNRMSHGYLPAGTDCNDDQEVDRARVVSRKWWKFEGGVISG